MSLLSAVEFVPGPSACMCARVEKCFALYSARHPNLIGHLSGVMDRASVLDLLRVKPNLNGFEMELSCN